MEFDLKFKGTLEDFGTMAYRLTLQRHETHNERYLWFPTSTKYANNEALNLYDTVKDFNTHFIITAQSLTNNESLLSVSCSDQEWPELEQSWELLLSEMFGQDLIENPLQLHIFREGKENIIKISYTGDKLVYKDETNKRMPHGVQYRTLLKLLSLVLYRRNKIKNFGGIPNWTIACNCADIDPKTATRWIEVYDIGLKIHWDDKEYDGEQFVSKLLEIEPYLESYWEEMKK